MTKLSKLSNIEFSLVYNSEPLVLFDSILEFSFFINGYGKMYDGNLPIASKVYPHRYWSLPGTDEDFADNVMEKLTPRENNDWHFICYSSHILQDLEQNRITHWFVDKRVLFKLTMFK